MWSRSLMVTVFVTALLAASSTGQDSTTLENVRKLGTSSIVKKTTVYYSAGYEKRARDIQPLIDDAIAFYDHKLGLKTQISVAVLNRAHWEKITKIPYGMPWVSDAPHVAFLPATGDGIVALDTLKRKPLTSVATIKQLKRIGSTYEQATHKTVDLIGLHELGHVYTQLLGFKPGNPNKWFSEFFASYFAYAYLKDKQPKLAELFDIMTAGTAAVSPPQKHTSLADFEDLYFGVGPDNYGWYQGKFMERVSQVYKAKGIDFISEVRKAFKPDEGILPVEVVLTRLELITPGFIEWSKRSHPNSPFRNPQ